MTLSTIVVVLPPPGVSPGGPAFHIGVHPRMDTLQHFLFTLFSFPDPDRGLRCFRFVLCAFFVFYARFFISRRPPKRFLSGHRRREHTW
ncbi:hypothetical protein [Alloalcanivorax profundimaris]|uniref:hypothetical protein n=1 Tax=Alloalcanivorax profundimaris TaxID=2735259 RepID=UPI0013707B32|nr:hypothetical protein [Alloalcanivorax profundimaris]MBF1801248.1 hypothetical protein [Alloalcanivorax profundimaris]MBM1142879.1 hypothetical protein [Alcanivorax sp. ZXX171]MCQ6263335.1 hypothetical protein [Alcanivorax sp. MM125-6]|tara:strand:+ start:390 stop:656 length:267 start_codon:yes stop_codon:yes gene_type:complete